MSQTAQVTIKVKVLEARVVVRRTSRKIITKLLVIKKMMRRFRISKKRN